MRIYKLDHDSNHFKSLTLVNGRDWEHFPRFDGRPMAGGWTSPPVKALTETQVDRRLPWCDFPSLSGSMPIFSKNALDALLPLIKDCGEIYRLDFPEREYFLFNVTRIVDALDLERSEIKWFSCEPKKILNVRKHVLKEAMVGEVPIFRLRHYSVSRFYVTDVFRDWVERHELTGFLFGECEVI